MKQYTVYLKTNDGEVICSFTVFANNKEEAITVARNKLSTRGIEGGVITL